MRCIKYIELYNNCRLLGLDSVVVTFHRTSSFHTCFALLVKLQSLVPAGICVLTLSHARAVEINEMPTLEITLVAFPKLKTAPERADRTLQIDRLPRPPGCGSQKYGLCYFKLCTGPNRGIPCILRAASYDVAKDDRGCHYRYAKSRASIYMGRPLLHQPTVERACVLTDEPNGYDIPEVYCYNCGSCRGGPIVRSSRCKSTCVAHNLEQGSAPQFSSVLGQTPKNVSRTLIEQAGGGLTKKQYYLDGVFYSLMSKYIFNVTACTATRPLRFQLSRFLPLITKACKTSTCILQVTSMGCFHSE